MAYLDDNPHTWRSILEALPDAIVIVDEEGVIYNVTRAFSELSGYDPEALVGRPVEDVIPERHRPRHLVHQRAFLEDPVAREMGRDMDLTVLCRDGSERAVDIAVSQLVLGARRWALVSMRDTSAQRATKFHRADEELRFRLAFENSMAPMIFTGLDDRIIAANDAFCDMLGRTRDEIIGFDSKHFTYPEDIGITEDSHRRVTSGEVDRMRYVKRYVHKDGHTIVVEVSRSSARDADGNILYYVISERDITEERALTNQLSHQALHDPLTGLANRALIEDRLSQAQARVNRQGGLGALLLVDLDDFKDVNDTHGHLVGDQLLVGVARRLEQVTRSSDTLCRFGGDEFLYLAEGLHNVGEAEQIATRLVNSLRDVFTIAGGEIEQTASIGIVVWSADDTDHHQVIENADVALYEAKRRGKGHHAVFEPGMYQHVASRFGHVNDLRQALRDREITMQYQPIVDTAINEVVGFEALMRWQHRERGWISPGEFLPLAESSDLILELGAFALREAVAAASSWAPGATGLSPYVTVNLSAHQFHDPGLASLIESVLASSGLAPERLVLEVTEGVALLDVAESASVMEQLNRLGVGLALDNFGTGFSSLSYLLQLRPRFLKIDHSFVRPPHESVYNDTLLEVIVSLGHKLNMAILAEGIETDAQLGRLRDFGCDLSQGFLFSPAVPASDAASLLGRALGPVAHAEHGETRS